MLKLLRDDEVYSEVIERGLRRARHSVWIATANVKNLMMSVNENEVESSMDFFKELASRRVAVRLLHSGVPSGSILHELKAGASPEFSRFFDMRRCVRTHFKCVLVDSKLLYMGSANFTGAGLGMKGQTRRNFEMGILTDEDGIMDTVADKYDRIWTGEMCRKCGRKRQCPVPLESPFGRND
ncbi:MAG TPA: phospholipase D family protein [bacterium]|nr:phospholipase D family protein [bacterium]